MKTHNPSNERIKRQYFDFLKEAKQQSEATVDAVAKALARFEAETKYRDFKTFNHQQAVAFKRRLADRDIHIQLTAAATEKLATEGYDPQFGARPLKRLIQQAIENELAREILAGRIAPGDTVAIDAGKMGFKFDKVKPEPAKSR